MNPQKDRWYYFGLYPRDWENPQFSFVGIFLAEDDHEREMLLQDQDGCFYFLRYLTEFEITDDYCFIRSEWLDSGRPMAEVIEELGEVIESGADRNDPDYRPFEPPKILIITERHEIHDVLGYDE